MKKTLKRIKGKKIITLLLFIFCVILGILVFVQHINRDDVPPDILFDSESMQLTEEEVSEVLEKNYSCLLNGVHAFDSEDGDISNYVIVYSINIYGDNSYAIVNYRVLDKSNNMASAQRLVYLKSPAQIYNDLLILAGDEASKIVKEWAGEDNTDYEYSPEKPVIEMENTVNLNVGESFDPEQHIVTLEDDKDSYGVLLQNCSMEGEYDLNSPGVYPLIFYVTDSDGNKSNASVLVLIVSISGTTE